MANLQEQMSALELKAMDDIAKCLQPKNEYVLVEVIKRELQTPGGLSIEQEKEFQGRVAPQAMKYGRVIRVGDGVERIGDKIGHEFNVEPGDIIGFAAQSRFIPIEFPRMHLVGGGVLVPKYGMIDGAGIACVLKTDLLDNPGEHWREYAKESKVKLAGSGPVLAKL